jgi:hypothetical protein
VGIAVLGLKEVNDSPVVFIGEAFLILCWRSTVFFTPLFSHTAFPILSNTAFPIVPSTFFSKEPTKVEYEEGPASLISFP